jgi:hypothetical protein
MRTRQLRHEEWRRAAPVAPRAMSGVVNARLIELVVMVELGSCGGGNTLPSYPLPTHQEA